MWFVQDQEIRDPELLARYEALLNNEERARHQRFVFARHRHQFLVTRALARAVLAEYDQALTPENLDFVRNEYGKPRVSNFSRDRDVSFNLSHTQGLVVLAVAPAGYRLGVDVESLTRPVDVEKLSARYFSPQEVRELQDVKVSELHERFFDLWTLKEAYIKACGMGLSIPLEDFSFHFSGKTIAVHFSPQRDDDPGRWRFWQLKPTGRHKVALAVSGRPLDGLSLICRRGVPMQGFQTGPCEIVRTSA